MATVKRCDKCGKFFDRSTSGDFEGRLVVTFEFDNYCFDEVKVKKDLCKECADKLEAWLKGGEHL